MNLSKFRQLIQLASTVFSNSYFGTYFTRTVNTNAFKGLCVPFLNCYACPSAVFSCPIGTLQHFIAMRVIPLYVLSFIAIIGLSIGRMACGWLCPFGFLQDLIYKIKAPKFKIPTYLNYMPFVVLLVLVICIPYYNGECMFSKVCPAGTLTAGIPWALWNPISPISGQRLMPDGVGIMFYVGLLILIVFLVWFVVSKRPFCRVACPMGAILALFNNFSMIRLEVSRNCDGCDICEINCPMDLNISMDVDSRDCIRCLECTRCGHVKVVTLFPCKERVIYDAKQSEKDSK